MSVEWTSDWIEGATLTRGYRVNGVERTVSVGRGGTYSYVWIAKTTGPSDLKVEHQFRFAVEDNRRTSTERFIEALWGKPTEKAAIGDVLLASDDHWYSWDPMVVVLIYRGRAYAVPKPTVARLQPDDVASLAGLRKYNPTAFSATKVAIDNPKDNVSYVWADCIGLVARADALRNEFAALHRFTRRAPVPILKRAVSLAEELAKLSNAL